MTGPTTQLRRCALSRMSLEFRTQLGSGTPQGNLAMFKVRNKMNTVTYNLQHPGNQVCKLIRFTADGSVENFKRRRQTELKHGRISMLATMGYITPEQLSFNVIFVCCFARGFADDGSEGLCLVKEGLSSVMFSSYDV